MDLFWLPKHPAFSDALRALKACASNADQDWFRQAQDIAGHRLNFLEEAKLGRAIQNKMAESQGTHFNHEKIVRIACLAETTVDHLMPSLHVSGLRRGLVFESYVAPYSQIRQEVFDPNSGLRNFNPDIVIIALASETATASLEPAMTASDVNAVITSQVEDLKSIWHVIQQEMSATVIQQTLSPISPSVFGHFDKAVAASPKSYIASFNIALSGAAFDHSCAILDLDQLFLKFGTVNLFSPMLWHHAKQELSPQCAPLWADHAGRIVQALLGLSKKCLVLDLDNTLWGGVIGDDGVNGITLGAGSSTGEAFAAFQRYAKILKQRGVLLAVCSKNTHEIALNAIDTHPEMILKSHDFSAFKANWDGKPGNIETIANDLNIGINSLVFFDDNPVERDHVRTRLPMVAVPEVPEDPAQYINCLESAGYFDAVSLTEDDLLRTKQYEANTQRQLAQRSAGNLTDYLASLDMELSVSPFCSVDMPRITQLVNKTNQFNLTTRRYQQAQIEQFASDQNTFTLAARLKDKFGDNGLISVVIAKPIDYRDRPALLIDTWLMSCRVLGRMVEHEVCNRLVSYAKDRSIDVIIGEYIETDRNKLVKNLYQTLGFERDGGLSTNQSCFYTMRIKDDIQRASTLIRIRPSDPAL